MQSDWAVKVEGLSKRYRLCAAHERAPYRTLRESLVRAARAPWNLLSRQAMRADSEFWALSDVSFEVPRGEVVGVIGRNGAGKSTLLKILSRITDPTTGRAMLRGRVASLLEVGTGFHDELTGRENVFLNGAILGMTRREIRRQFDEIVAFAEVDRFLDTPVKRYSSGMRVRLAFAVAAHLQPEILIVDEVLAVGDAQFQKKCLGKMSEVAQGGRTVFFVSHNLGVLQRLCDRALLLDRGRLSRDGSPADVVAAYLCSGTAAPAPNQSCDLSDATRTGSGESRFVEIAYASDSAALNYRPYPEGQLEVRLRIESDAARCVSSMAITIYDLSGTKLVNADTLSLGQSIWLEAGINDVRFHVERLNLTPGVYALGLWMSGGPGSVLDRLETAVELEVIEPPVKRLGARPASDGVVACKFAVHANE